MRSVYKNPQATIVAAAGIHSNFGLPGAGFRNRSSSRTLSSNSIPCAQRFYIRSLLSQDRNGCLGDGHTKKRCSQDGLFSSPKVRFTSNAKPCNAAKQFRCCRKYHFLRTISDYVRNSALDSFSSLNAILIHGKCGGR